MVWGVLAACLLLLGPQPVSTALFAKGKKTTLGGSKRAKKPKFRMGPV